MQQKMIGVQYAGCSKPVLDGVLKAQCVKLTGVTWHKNGKKIA